MAKSPLNSPPPPDSPTDQRASIKCARTLADRFFAAAAVRGESGNAYLTRLMDAAAALPNARMGSIVDLTEKLGKLEAKQGACSEALAELCELLCALNARFDDGIDDVVPFLSDLKNGGAK